MPGWIDLGPKWCIGDCYRVLQILKQNRIRCRMPADDMFFVNPFSLPHPNRRWSILVRSRDREHALSLLALEGLDNRNAGPFHNA